MARTIVVVPPTMLVQMFGVPDRVALPSAKGGETVFDCYGKRFYVKKVTQSAFMLTCPLHYPQARFGTAGEIADDIGRVLETGVLPREKTSVA